MTTILIWFSVGAMFGVLVGLFLAALMRANDVLGDDEHEQFPCDAAPSEAADAQHEPGSRVFIPGRGVVYVGQSPDREVALHG